MPQIQFPDAPRRNSLRTLLVDGDRAMLQHCLSRIGKRQTLTVATSKALALQLLRQGQIDVVVACEKLVDGSGLALLDEIQAQWPNVVRVFCTEQQRLSLVRNRLSAFRLRHTLSYPVRPIRLEVLLMSLANARTASTIRLRALIG